MKNLRKTPEEPFQDSRKHPWDVIEYNWEIVHIDYFSLFDSYNFLLCFDAKSKWAEIPILKNSPTSNSTIKFLNNILAFHGYPNLLASDNATIFTSTEFKNYCSTSGISQRLIAPGYPATNRLAERNVQTLKQHLKAMLKEPGAVQEKVQRILFRYRATPLFCGKSQSSNI